MPRVHVLSARGGGPGGDSRVPRRLALTPRSLFASALDEAERHKYLASERAGCDLGDSAIDDWHQRHWTIFLRHRWIEHLLGNACWEEFEPGRWGRLRHLFAGHPVLLREVVEKVRQGAENLDVLWWARASGRDARTVARMLVELRLNDIRCTRFCLRFAKP